MADAPVHYESSYVVRPNYKQKFRPSVVSQLMKQTLHERLHGATYQPDLCPTLTKEIADEIKGKLKEIGLERYKFVVNVVIGEQKGEGVRMDCRCFWDVDSDNFAQENFTNDSIFCVAVAFGIYFY